MVKSPLSDTLIPATSDRGRGGIRSPRPGQGCGTRCAVERAGTQRRGGGQAFIVPGGPREPIGQTDKLLAVG